MNISLMKGMCCATVLVASTASTASTASNDTIEEIVVIAHPLSGEGLAQAATVLEGEVLHRELDTNLGATLASQPGVHSASFGNAVGRPIIHGLSGPRIRIMEDRIDTLDVSVTSGDHAVGVEPFIAERIEILKGASTLLYGTGSIGGAIDVHTGRIPHVVPERKLVGGIETRFDNNTHGNSSAIKLNGGVNKIAWHVDAAVKDGDDYQIPGSNLTRTEFATSHSASDLVRGTLPGSAFESRAGALGSSYIGEWGFVGLAVSKIDAEYGLPGSTAGVRPTLELNQNRTDVELAIKDPLPSFSSLNVRAGYNDYQHQELEPDGGVATDFTNQAWEARMELMYDTSRWSGAVGWQHSDKRFSALGEEAFVEPVVTKSSGLFWVGERAFGWGDLELGFRVGETKHNPRFSDSEEFSTVATSIGVVIPLTESLRIGVLTDYSTRAPMVEELFSNGPHLVSGTFELGNPSLDNERALSISATLTQEADNWSTTVSAYSIRFSDFIFQQANGLQIEGLPVFTYQQGDTRFYGIDMEFKLKVMDWQQGELWLQTQFDFVKASIRDGGGAIQDDRLPRTPPKRIGVGIEFNWHSFDISMDYLRVSDQDRVAEFERETDGYNDLRAYLGITRELMNDRVLNIFLKGKNLTDDEQRNHTSFIKEFAPRPGRTLEAGVRLSF